MKRRNFFIDDSLWEKLIEYAAAHGMSIATVIRIAVIEFLRREE
jgi:hypothetical protein